jgi:hypothetical protein
LEQYGRISQIQQAQQQNQLAALKMQEYQRGVETQNRLRSLDPSAANYMTEVMRLDPELGSQLMLRSKQQTAAERAAAASEAEGRAKNLSYWQGLARDSARTPTDDVVAGLARRAVELGVTDEGTASSQLQQLLAMPPEQRGQVLAQYGASAAAPPAAPATPADVATMQALGFPLTQQGYEQFRAAQRQPKTQSATSIAEFNFARTPEGGGFKGSYSDFLASKQPKPAQVNIRLPEQEKEERGARGKLLVKQYEGVSEAARIAGRTLPALQTQEQILDSGFKTGFGTEAQKAGASVLSALGVPEATKYATNAQAFVSAMNQAVLQRQLEQKGPQTEADALRITQTGAQLGNTPDANKFIVSVAKAQLKRDIDQRNFYDSWWKKNGTYDGAEDAWVTGPGGKSLFDAPELKRYAAPAKPTAAPTAPSGVQPYTDAEKERRYQEWKRKQGQP